MTNLEKRLEKLEQREETEIEVIWDIPVPCCPLGNGRYRDDCGHEGTLAELSALHPDLIFDYGGRLYPERNAKTVVIWDAPRPARDGETKRP